jgi:hypothetical protein
MGTRKRFIGKVVLFWHGERLPTDFFMDYQENHFVYIAETEMPHGAFPKIISSADQLIDLLRIHRQRVKSIRSESNGLNGQGSNAQSI